MKPIVTMAAPVTTVPATVVATPNLSTTYTQPESTERTTYCKTCWDLDRHQPLFALPAQTVSLPHSDCSNVEDDWDGKRQKEEGRDKNIKCEKKYLIELKQKPITYSYYPPSPQYMPGFKGDTVHPALTDTLVPIPEQEEEEKPIEEKDKDTESDYDSDDTVTILRAKYV